MTLRPEGLPGGVVFHQTDDPVCYRCGQNEKVAR